MIKAIILDIDGTLLDDSKKMLASTRESLLKVQENGIKVVLSSGRPHRGMEKLGEELKLADFGGYLVSYNGAKVVNCETEEVVFNQALSVELSQNILEHLKSFEVIPMIEQGEYMFVNDVFDDSVRVPELNNINIIQYESRGGNFKLQEIEDLAQHVDFELNKILVAGKPEYLKENYQEISLPFMAEVQGAFSAPVYYEFTAKGIDKANALIQTLEPLGIRPEEMLVFGDGENDLSMLNYGGVGIAMGNANEKVKSLADDVTEDNNSHGIYQALVKYLPEIFKK